MTAYLVRGDARLLPLASGKGQVMQRDEVFKLIEHERYRQDLQWGGTEEHDKYHSKDVWVEILRGRLDRLDGAMRTLGPVEYERRLVQLAAVAIAALEARP